LAEIEPEALEGLIAASDLYGEGYVDVDEFLAAMLANSNYTKHKDAVRAFVCVYGGREGRARRDGGRQDMSVHLDTCVQVCRVW
jgi:hypothetical protein